MLPVRNEVEASLCKMMQAQNSEEEPTGLPQVREKSGKKIFFQGQGKVREI